MDNIIEIICDCIVDFIDYMTVQRPGDLEAVETVLVIATVLWFYYGLRLFHPVVEDRVYIYLSEIDFEIIERITSEAYNSAYKYYVRPVGEPNIEICIDNTLSQTQVQLYGGNPLFTHGISERLTKAGYAVQILDQQKFPGEILAQITN